MESDVYKAWLDQQIFTEEGEEAWQKQIDDAHASNEKRALLHLATPKASLLDIVGGQTQLKEGELDQTHEKHPNFEHLHHDKVRISFKRDDLGGGEDSDGISMGDMTSEDVL